MVLWPRQLCHPCSFYESCCFAWFVKSTTVCLSSSLLAVFSSCASNLLPGCVSSAFQCINVGMLVRCNFGSTRKGWSLLFQLALSPTYNSIGHVRCRAVRCNFCEPHACIVTTFTFSKVPPVSLMTASTIGSACLQSGHQGDCVSASTSDVYST